MELIVIGIILIAKQKKSIDISDKKKKDITIFIINLLFKYN